jgi:putative lipoic acid-binding regulatory protein
MTSKNPDSPPSPESSQDLGNARTSLIEYPCVFPIKVMGPKAEHFVHTLSEIAKSHDPFFDASTIELRESSGGHYLGVTLMINATSRPQLDQLYLALTAHPMVKVVL